MNIDIIEKTYKSIAQGNERPKAMIASVPAVEHMLFKLGRKRMSVVDDEGKQYWIRSKSHDRDSRRGK